MRFLKRFSYIFWKEIIKIAFYLYNKTPQQSLDWRTLYEKFQEYIIAAQKIISPRKPIFYHLKAYTYEVYVFIKSKDDPDKPRRF